MGSNDCGCPTGDDWGGDQKGGYDGGCSATACLLGCDLANDPKLQDGFFHGMDVVIESATPITKTLEDYIASRTGCTESCNTNGNCCTLGLGGCNKVPCTTGCHIAFFTSDVDACKAECAIANDGAINSCSYTYRHEEIIGANFNPWWDITGGIEGVNTCRGSNDCGCLTGDDWGGDQKGGHDGDCLASACLLGCDSANDPKPQDGFFHGEDVVIGY
jgi:hypothetical protein